jgi:2-dehydropantoate 2-reductase
MEILVFGAGAVGGYLGCRLAAAGNNVTLIARGQAAEAYRINGLVVSEEGYQITARPKVVQSLRRAFVEEDNPYDVILFTMKAYDVEKALNELVAFSPSPPPIITLQNGIGVEEMVINEFGSENIIAGSLTTPLSHEIYHLIVVEHVDRGLALAPTVQDQNIDQFVDLFNDSGIETTSFQDYRSMKWSKAMLNMVGNATSAILNRQPQLIYKNRKTFKIEREMLKETLKVMSKLKLKALDLPGVSTARLAFAIKRLPTSIVQPILTNIVASGRGSKLPSFHLDLAAGKTKNEVVYHNGAVAAAAFSINIPTPVNAALNDILIKMAQSEIDHKIYNGNPKRLVAEINKYQKSGQERK